MISTTNSQPFRLFAFCNLLKFSKNFSLALLLAALPHFASAATVNIGDGVTTAASSLSNGDSINFSGTTGSPSEGTLNIDTSRTLQSVGTNNGIVNFTSASTLSIDNSLSVKSVSFSGDGILDLQRSIYITSGVSTSSDNTGSLNISSAYGIIYGDVGSSTNKLKSIVVSDTSDGGNIVSFSGNVYSHETNIGTKVVVYVNSSYNTSNDYDLGHVTIGKDGFMVVGNGANLVNLNTSGLGDIELPGSSNGTVANLTGDAVISSGMSFIFANHDSEIPSPLSKFVAAGNNSVTISDGITMNFYVIDASKNIPLNTDYLIVDASASGSSLNIDVSKINISTNSLLANFMLKEEDNKLYVYNSEYNYNNLKKLSGSDSSLAQAALNNSGFSGSEMGTVRTQLLAISDMGQLKKAANSLNLTKNSTAQIGATQIGGKIANVISSRMSNFSAKNSGVSSGDSAIETGIWGQVFGGKAKQGEISNQESYNANTSGLIFGADAAFDWGKNLNSIFGASFAWGQTAINNVSSDKRTNIDSYQISLYNNNAKADGLGLYNENQLSVSTNRYKTRRAISVGTFNAIATANFNGMQYGAKTGFGYNAKVSEKLLVTPNAAIEYYRISQEDYSESGAGNAGLSVQNKDFNLALSSLGVKFTSNLQVGQKTLMPKLDLAWIHNLTNKGQSSTASFIAGGNKVTASSNSLLKNTFNIGTELNLMSKDNSSVALRYDLQLGHEFTSQIVNLKYRMMF